MKQLEEGEVLGDEFDIEQELESTQMGGLIDMEQPQEEVTEEEVIEEDE